MNQRKTKCNLSEIYPKINGEANQGNEKLKTSALGLNLELLDAQKRIRSTIDFSGLKQTIESFEAMNNSIKRALKPISIPTLEIYKGLGINSGIFKSFEATIRQYQESMRVVSNTFSRLKLPDLSGITDIIRTAKGIEASLGNALFKDLNKTSTLLDSIKTGANFDFEIPTFKTLELIEEIALNPESKTQNCAACKVIKEIKEIKEIASDIRNEQNTSQRREDAKWLISLVIALYFAIFPSQPDLAKKQEHAALTSLHELIKLEIKKLNEMRKLLEFCETKTKTVVKNNPNSGAITRVKLHKAAPVKAVELHGKWCQIEFNYKGQVHSGWCQKKCLHGQEVRK